MTLKHDLRSHRVTEQLALLHHSLSCTGRRPLAPAHGCFIPRWCRHGQDEDDPGAAQRAGQRGAGGQPAAAAGGGARGRRRGGAFAARALCAGLAVDGAQWRQFQVLFGCIMALIYRELGKRSLLEGPALALLWYVRISGRFKRCPAALSGRCLPLGQAAEHALMLLRHARNAPRLVPQLAPQ